MFSETGTRADVSSSLLRDSQSYCRNEESLRSAHRIHFLVVLLTRLLCRERGRGARDSGGRHVVRVTMATRKPHPHNELSGARDR